MSKIDIKKKIEDTFGDLCTDIFVELQKTTDSELTEAMSKIINAVPDKDTGLRIFIECVEQYVENIIFKETDLCDYSFEEGMSIIMIQKYQDMKKQMDDQQKEWTITFYLKQDRRVYSKFIIKNSFKALDMCYLVMSNMHIGNFLHIYCKLPAREYRDENSITRLPEYEFEFNKNEFLSDLDIGIGDMFSILLKDDNDFVQYEIVANVDNITENKHPDLAFVLLGHGYGGPDLPEEKKEDYKNQDLDEEIITAMFLYEKMYYERPDLYDQIDDNLSNIMELGAEMFRDELSDITDSDDEQINPSLLN